MKYEAVIFDLFGTLVDSPSLKERSSMLEKMASILTVPEADFIKFWNETLTQRDTGEFLHIEDILDHIGRQMGLSFEKESIKLVTGLRFDWVRKLMIPRPQAVEVLSQLKSQQYKIGLISDCSMEVPLIWKETPLDSLIEVAIFYCSLNIKKPDPRIYKLAVDKLGVRMDKCLYIGDGSSHELTGALQVGMYPVLIRMQDNRQVFQTEAESDDWRGPQISSFEEIFRFLE
jgi:putative hydrolase of the HAD superfamily